MHLLSLLTLTQLSLRKKNTLEFKKKKTIWKTIFQNKNISKKNSKQLKKIIIIIKKKTLHSLWLNNILTYNKILYKNFCSFLKVEKPQHKILTIFFFFNKLQINTNQSPVRRSHQVLKASGCREAFVWSFSIRKTLICVYL